MNIEQLLSMAMGQRGPAKKAIGVIPLETLAVMAEHRSRFEVMKDRLQEEGSKKVEAFIEALEAETQLLPEWVAMKAEGKQMWDMVYDAVGIPQDQRSRNHSIDSEDGILYEVESDEDDEEGPGNDKCACGHCYPDDEEEPAIIPTRHSEAQ